MRIVISNDTVVAEDEIWNLTIEPGNPYNDFIYLLAAPLDHEFGADRTARLPQDPNFVNFGQIVGFDVGSSLGVARLFSVGVGFWWNHTTINHGLMSISSEGRDATVYTTSGGWGPSILNIGDMVATAPNGFATGIHHYGQQLSGPFAYEWSIVNAEGGSITAIGDRACAVRTVAANFYNHGLVDAQADGASIAVWANWGHIENSGVIRATSVSGSSTAIALGLIDAFNAPGNTLIINSGLIEATTAVDEKYDGNVVTTILNSGEIRGAILLYDGNDVVRNTGTILGDVVLGSGDDLYDGGGGSLVGHVFARAGSDTVVLSGSGEIADGGDGIDLLVLSLNAASLPVTYQYAVEPGEVRVGGAVVATVSNFERVQISGGEAYDSLTGGAGDDVLNLGRGGGFADGAGGNDIVGFDFSDQNSSVTYVHNDLEAVATIDGMIVATARNAEAVNFIGGSLADQIVGGIGDDVITGGAGGDTIDGEAGFDIVSYAFSASGVVVALGASAAGGDADGDILVNIEGVVGSAYSDSLSGDAQANTLDGGGGDDTLRGGGGNDIYVLNSAADSVVEMEDEGDDTVFASVAYALPDHVENLVLAGAAATSGSGNALNNSITGNNANNTIEGGAGADVLNGGRGQDTISYAGSGSGVYVNLGTATVYGGHADGDSISSFENAIGSAFNDTLIGWFDTSFLEGGAGADVLDGASGWAVAVYSRSQQAITVNLETGLAEGGEATGDVLLHIQGVLGSDFNDLITSKVGGGWLVGGGGDDYLTCHLGQNYLDGGAGFDTVSYGLLDQAVTVDLVRQAVNQGVYVEDRLTSIERVVGTNFADLFIGNDEGNVLDGGAGNDTVRSGAGNDVVRGGAGQDSIDGGVGNDTIAWAWGDGIDVIDGGADSDTFAITGHVNDSILRATLVGGVLTSVLDMTLTNIEAVTADMQGGVDWLIYTTTEAVTADLGAGSASGFSSLLNVENIISGSGADVLTGSSDANKLVSGDGADTLRGGAGNDELVGGGGDDLLFGGAGNDILRGQGGTDYVSYADETDSFFVTFNGQANVRRGSAGAAIEDLLDGVEHFYAGTGNDTILGNSINNIFFGDEGNDTLNGGGGYDTLYGGGGNDTIIGGGAADSIFGGEGDDTILYTFGDGADVISGDGGFDTLAINGTNADNILNVAYHGDATVAQFFGNWLAFMESVTANMQAGVDWLVYTISTNVHAVNVDLGASTASGFSFITGIENVIGATGNDTLVGSNIVNTLDGGDGDDTLSGLNGNDTLRGGAGADTLTGGIGADSIDAGAGNDTIVYAFGDGADSINGGADSDTLNITGSASDNLLRASWNGSALTQVLDANLASVETINADMAGGVDWIIYTASAAVTVDLDAGTATGFASIASVENAVGGAGGDTLTGSSGVNTLDGGDGADTLSGLAGADVIRGGAGDDVISGGADNDNLTGGAGADRFVYAGGAGADTITDFDADSAGGQDVIDLTILGITALDFAARVVINDLGAHAEVVIDGAITLTLLGVNGDGANTLDASDFLLAP